MVANALISRYVLKLYASGTAECQQANPSKKSILRRGDRLQQALFGRKHCGSIRNNIAFCAAPRKQVRT